MPNMKDFKWFDTASHMDTDPKTGQPIAVPRKKGALSIVGEALQGVSAPFADAYQGGHANQASVENARLRDQQEQDQAAITNAGLQKEAIAAAGPVNQAKVFEAQLKLRAIQKQQQGLPLDPYEKSLLDIKDQSNRPSEWQAYQEAQSEAFRLNGGSLLSGISPENQKKYEALRDKLFLQNKIKFGLATPDDTTTAARQWLGDHGYAQGDDNVKTLLERNPNLFKGGTNAPTIAK